MEDDDSLEPSNGTHPSMDAPPAPLAEARGAPKHRIESMDSVTGTLNVMKFYELLMEKKVSECFTRCLTLRDVFKMANTGVALNRWIVDEVSPLPPIPTENGMDNDDDGAMDTSADTLNSGSGSHHARISSTTSSNGMLDLESPIRSDSIAINFFHDDNFLRVHIRGLAEFRAYFRTMEVRDGTHWTKRRLAPVSIKLDYHDSIAGPLPTYLASITTLEWLDLGRSDLTGPIPQSLGSMLALRKVYLAGNKLVGTIPESLGNLHKLVELSLAGNELTGPIPHSLGKLSMLRYLSLRDNKLSGTIPASLGRLSKLKQLWLNANYLVGPVPEALGDLANLEELYLNNNQLSGDLPASLGRLAKLRIFSARHNQIAGHIPPSLSQLAKLHILYLDKNDMKGPIPEAFTELKELQEMNLLGNKFEGKQESRNTLSMALPDCVCYI